jgi:hypothetical protein
MRVTILEAIRRAVGDGRLREPFGLGDVAAALRDHFYYYGSLAAALSRYSRPGVSHAGQPLRRVGPGKYCLAGSSPNRDRPPEPPPGI